MIEANSPRYYKLALQYASLTFLYYDYVLTFKQEFRYIWSERLRTSTILYVLCRYAMLANLLYLLAVVNILDDCSVWYQVVAAISILGRIGIMTVMTIRTYVVLGCRPIVLIPLGLLELTCIVLSALKVPASVCGKRSTGYEKHVYIALSILVLIFDALVTVLTAIRTQRALQTWKKNGIQYKNTIIYFLWEQGILYFVAIFGLQLAAIVLLFIAPGGFLQRLLNAFTLPTSGLLAARFLLHLRAWGDKHESRLEECGEPTRPCHLSFVSIPTPVDSVFQDFGVDPVVCPPPTTGTGRRITELHPAEEH